VMVRGCKVLVIDGLVLTFLLVPSPLPLWCLMSPSTLTPDHPRQDLTLDPSKTVTPPPPPSGKFPPDSLLTHSVLKMLTHVGRSFPPMELPTCPNYSSSCASPFKRHLPSTLPAVFFLPGKKNFHRVWDFARTPNMFQLSRKEVTTSFLLSNAVFPKTVIFATWLFTSPPLQICPLRPPLTSCRMCFFSSRTRPPFQIGGSPPIPYTKRSFPEVRVLATPRLAI